jgi:alpha-galactosidase
MHLRLGHAVSDRRYLRRAVFGAFAWLTSSGACLVSAAAFAATTDAPIAPATTSTLPRILGPAAFAARPASPFVYKVAAVGQQPLTFSATGIPTGLSIAADTGIISGTTPAAGSYPVTFTVSNSLGTATQKFALVAGDTLAQTPPMGWNSYDSFGGGVTESEVLAAAEAQKAQLQPYGWNYVVVDYLWFDNEQAVDSNGRYLPSKSRFPSATGTLGFKPLADKIHAMGLNFGIHIMRGIPRKTVSSNPTLAGSNLKAADAGDTSDACPWDNHMWGVKGNTAAGQAWYDSIFAQYAEWGIDFVKVDDLLNNQAPQPYPYHQAEVDAIRKAIDKSGRSIVLSLSPGPMKTSDAAHLNANANMWRMVNDFWDKNGLSNLTDVFSASGSWQATPNLSVGHWPDGDMLPLGYIGPRSPVGGAARVSALTHNEQISVMSLWSILPSPLMFGGNVPKLTTDATGPFTLALLTNDEIIAIDQDSAGNKGKRLSQSGDQQIWTKSLSGGRKAVAFFNRGNADVAMSATLTQLGMSTPLTARDLWQRKDLPAPTTSVSVTVSYKGAAMILLAPPVVPPEGGTGGTGGTGGAPGAGGASGAGVAGGADGGAAGTAAGSGAAGLEGGLAGSGGSPTPGAGAPAAAGTSGAASTVAGSGASTPQSPGAADSGCSCRLTVGQSRPRIAFWLLAIAAVGLSRRRRRAAAARQPEW